MRHGLSSRGRSLAASFALVTSLATTPVPTQRAAADEPHLAFDFGRTLECRDITPPEFAESYPDERIIEGTLRLSIYLSRGDMNAIDAVRVEINDLDQRLRVHDFAPRTVLASKLSADVEWTKTTESTHELGASLGGELPACIGDVVANVTPSINAAKGGREVITEKQMRVAPKHVVVASGTINHEHGVFFTLRPSEQTALEGVHELKVSFVVPAAWRGDAVRVSCEASGEQKVLWVKQQKVWAEMSSGVALYLAGDVDARRAAERRVRE
jgi:hypothetical protein